MMKPYLWFTTCLIVWVSGVVRVEGAPPTVSVSGERPLHVCLISGSEEYESAITLPKFQRDLEAGFHIRCTLLQAEGDVKLPGLGALDQSDLVVLFTRRIKISAEELAPLKRYVASGKPILGIRTASHGFQNYLEFDKEIMGGNYKGHLPNGTQTRVTRITSAREHPILKGIAESWDSKYTLYRTAPLAENCVPLLQGACTNGTAAHPVAWIRESPEGRRVFYTSLGGREDWNDPNFRKLLHNALVWSTRCPEATLRK